MYQLDRNRSHYNQGSMILLHSPSGGGGVRMITGKRNPNLKKKEKNERERETNERKRGKKGGEKEAY